MTLITSNVSYNQSTSGKGADGEEGGGDGVGGRAGGVEESVTGMYTVHA